MKVLGFIPARGGSKGVPGKNIKILAGKPLLAYTTEVALRAKSLDKVLLSTDDEKIAELGIKLGVEVPFIRPAELALDSTPTLPVVQHALEFLKKSGEEYDAVCILQATNPLRKAEDIDACVKMFEVGNFDCVFSTSEIPLDHNPYWAFIENDEGLLHLATGGTEPITRRQLLPKAFKREGSIYVTRSKTILENNSLYGEKVGGYLLDLPVSINIDTMEDWKRAEEYYKNLK